MKSAFFALITIVALGSAAAPAEAQWVRHYRPVVVQPQPVFVQPQSVWVQPQPVFVSPAPVHRVYRRPVVTYQPTTVVTTRHRPILGGTVVHSRPGYRRIVW
jgi:hypothetical protein